MSDPPAGRRRPSALAKLAWRDDTATRAVPERSDTPAVWFHDEWSDTISTGYCMDQIREAVLGTGAVAEADEPDGADLVHLNTLPFRPTHLDVALRSRPVVATQHGGYHWWRRWRNLHEYHTWKFPALRLIHAVTARTVDAIGFSTETTRRLAIETGKIPADRTRVIPLGQSDRFQDRADTDTDDPFVLSVINSNVPRKNIPTLLATMRRLPETRFVLPGKMWPEYPRSLPANAEVTGYVTESELIDYYNRASALYLPTLFEGFGLPFVEAMACGTAVVTTHGGSPGEVCDTAAAYVSDPFDPGEHERRLRRIIDDDSYRETLEARGRERAEAFSWKQTARRYIDLYRDLLDGEAAASGSAR